MPVVVFSQLMPRSGWPIAPDVHRVRVDQFVKRLDPDADRPSPEADRVEVAGGDVAADSLGRDGEDLGLAECDELAGRGSNGDS